MNITEKFLERVRASEKRQTFRDDEQTGFGVRIESAERGGRKSFFYNAKVGGQIVFKSLGEWPAVSVKQARDDVREWAGKASEWKRAGFPEDANPFAKPKRAQRTTVPTFRELVEAYIRNHLLDAEVGALDKERAEYDVRLVVNKRFSAWLDLPIDQVTTEHVLEAKNAAAGRYAQNSIVELVRRLYNWSAGTRNGMVNFWTVSNPAKDIALNTPEKRKKFLKPDQLLRFNNELEKEMHRTTHDVLTLLLATGARKANVYAMRWQDISFELANWHVPMSKSGESYEVALTPAAMAVLERRRREIPQDSTAIWVFPAKSKTGHIDDVKKRWAVFRKRAGLDGFRLHDLRRTKGSYAALAGESLQKIAAVLGHKTTASTEIYARLMEESARKTSLASDQAMEKMMAHARKRLKRGARKPRLLEVANG